MYKIIKLKLPVNVSQNEIEDLIQFAMNDCECAGVEEFSIEEDRVDELLGARAYSGGDLPISLLDEVDAVCERDIKFFFEQTQEPLERFVDFLKIKKMTFSIEQFELSDWDAEWRKTYTPVEVDSDLWIVPEWMKAEYPASKSVYINPGQGFGTGKHETTFMCLQLMKKTATTSINHALDLGCGSGILGIALLRLCNASVVFCDIDKNALDNTLYNLALNFEDRDLAHCSLVLRERLLVDPQKYDLVFANILLSALEEEYQNILASLKTGGFLIASGLLNHQVEEFISIFNGFETVEIISIRDWSACLLRKIK